MASLRPGRGGPTTCSGAIVRAVRERYRLLHAAAGRVPGPFGTPSASATATSKRPGLVASIRDQPSAVTPCATAKAARRSPSRSRTSPGSSSMSFAARRRACRRPASATTSGRRAREAVDIHWQLAPAKRERLEHAGEPEHVVGMEVRQEDLGEIDAARPTSGAADAGCLPRSRRAAGRRPAARGALPAPAGLWASIPRCRGRRCRDPLGDSRSAFLRLELAGCAPLRDCT